MQIFYSDQYVLPLPAGHRFPMRKYAALRERVATFAQTLMHVPPAASIEELSRVHAATYITAVCNGTLDGVALRRIGFPWSTEMVERSRRSTGATIAAARSALAAGCGINLAGGTHHAHAAHGEGFCVFNDAAVAIRAMQAEGRVGRALIVDLDVHQGNGTAAIFAADPDVFTFSMHGRNNFPFRKFNSSFDIELADRTADVPYLRTLATALPLALQASRPHLAIYLAGADPFERDRLGKLALTKDGLGARDLLVLETLRDAAVPVAVVMAGGYAQEVNDVVDIHTNTIRTALRVFGAGSPGETRASKPRVRARTRQTAVGDAAAC